MKETKQEYIVLYQNMMYTSTSLKKMMKQTMNSKVVAILILYIADNKITITCNFDSLQQPLNYYTTLLIIDVSI